VTFTANANGTATIAGTPALGTNGSYTVALLAGNGIGVAASQTLVVTTTSAPVITTSAQDQIVAPGATATFTAAATSTPSPTVKWQRTNDAGTYVDIPGATATSYSFVAATTDSGHKYRAVFSNGVGLQAMTAATLTVRLAPTISSPNAGSFVVGTTGNISVIATGFPFPALTLTGAPAWLTLQDNGNGTGSLTGSAPAAEEGATLLVTITASNGVTTDATQQFALTVKQAPSVIASPQNTVVTPGSTVTLSAGRNRLPGPDHPVADVDQWWRVLPERARRDLGELLVRRAAWRQRRRVPRGVHQPGE